MIRIEQKIEPVIKVAIPLLFVMTITAEIVGLWTVFFIIASGFLFYSFKRFYELSIAKRWIAAKATVIDVDIAYCQPVDRYWRPLPKIYSPYITYEYLVGEKKYISSKYSVNSSASWSECLDKIQTKIEKIRVGDTIDVYYNPSRLKQSAVDISPDPYTKFKAIFLLVNAISVAIIWIQICWIHYS